MRFRVVALAVAALVLAPTASAKPRLGIFGPLDRFAGLTGQRSSVGHVILSWNLLPNRPLMSKLGEMPLLVSAWAKARSARVRWRTAPETRS